MNPQHTEFLGRLDRVERIRRKGGGFEAEGTMGGFASRVETRQRPILRMAILAAAVFLLAKALLLSQLGFDTYQLRLEALAEGTSVDKIGAYLMQMDALTIWLSELLAF